MCVSYYIMLLNLTSFDSMEQVRLGNVIRPEHGVAAVLSIS